MLSGALLRVLFGVLQCVLLGALQVVSLPMIRELAASHRTLRSGLRRLRRLILCVGAIRLRIIVGRAFSRLVGRLVSLIGVVALD